MSQTLRKRGVRCVWLTAISVDFEVLNPERSVHLSVVCFHAQQAVEKSLKAVRGWRFESESRRTHSLTELASLLQQHGRITGCR